MDVRVFFFVVFFSIFCHTFQGPSTSSQPWFGCFLGLSPNDHRGGEIPGSNQGPPRDLPNCFPPTSNPIYQAWFRYLLAWFLSNSGLRNGFFLASVSCLIPFLKPVVVICWCAFETKSRVLSPALVIKRFSFFMLSSVFIPVLRSALLFHLSWAPCFSQQNRTDKLIFPCFALMSNPISLSCFRFFWSQTTCS